MAAWVPAWPSDAYTSNQNLTYRQIYIATVGQRRATTATLRKGFSTNLAPKARPRLFVTSVGNQTLVPMSYWRVANDGTIMTTGLDSCVAIAVGAYDSHARRFVSVAMAHLTGSYYQGGKGLMYTDGDWETLFEQMPPNFPNDQLYAVLAGSSHRGGWYADNSVMGGIHGDTYPSNPDRVWEDLVPHNIPRGNFLYYTLAPGICNTMGFAIRLNDGALGEI